MHLCGWASLPLPPNCRLASDSNGLLLACSSHNHNSIHPVKPNPHSDTDTEPLSIEGASALLPFFDSDRSFVLTLCSVSGVVFKCAKTTEVAEGQVTALVASEVLEGKWLHHQVPLPITSLFAAPVEHLTLLCTYDRVAILYMQSAYIFSTQLTQTFSPPFTLKLAQQCSVAGESLKSVLLTSRYLILGLQGRLQVYYSDSTEDKVPHTVVPFADRTPLNQSTELHAVTACNVMALTKGGALFLIKLQHPFAPDICLSIQTMQKISSLAILPPISNPAGPDSCLCCLVDGNSILHLASLPVLWENRTSSTPEALRPLQSILYPSKPHSLCFFPSALVVSDADGAQVLAMKA
eukprot:NODE_2882_length_1072_cov_34.258201_g2749_i0.p1 GENE.NODE_2882_length_1072_cov_34.258201_g2749_i0~~NODE_2882_length_1072_cov_34.258201_g2749_i0.p1  ORF type:complete len:351 (+),score=67.97 NODE_2882_length_1072_cov_34.258201_g2749_i0:3-1055(+)